MSRKKITIDKGFHVRLNSFMESALGVKQVELAKKLGITANYLSLVLNGKRGPSAEMIAGLFTHYRSYLDWLLTGEGSMRAEEKTGAMFAGEEQSQFANGRYNDVYSDVREILASGDDFIIRAFRERLKDYRIAIAMSHERRDLQQRLATVEKEMKKLKKMKGKGGSPGERPGGAGTDAGTASDTTEGEADTEKKAM